MEPSLRRSLDSVLADDQIVVEDDQIQNNLEDNSWLSPLLMDHFDDMQARKGKNLNVQGVLTPATEEQLREVIACLVEHRVPITMKGGGTSNFGQMIPMEGGMIVSVEGMTGIEHMDSDSVTVKAGTTLETVQKKAGTIDRELPVMTTTYASSCASGWVAGGHVGLGANSHGTIWDQNVLGVRLLSARTEPEAYDLRTQEELHGVLHTYGTTGVITEVTFPLVEARPWEEVVPVFDRFADGVNFVHEVNRRDHLTPKVVALQEPPISRSFRPLQDRVKADQSIALSIVDQRHHDEYVELCKECDGDMEVWSKPGSSENRLSIEMMVYGHRMLWIKKLEPDAAFLHVYFSSDRVDEQLDRIEQRFGDGVYREFKYIRSEYLCQLHDLPEGPGVPAAVLTILPGTKDRVREVMEFCDSIGMPYLNPHTIKLEESGLVRDIDSILDFKQRTDPHHLLNPGKIGNFSSEKEAGR